MKAAVFREVGQPLEIEEVAISKPGPREVLIRTAAAGVCHSDLHFVEGLYPAITPVVLGHESAGVVEQVGSDVTYVKKGDHVKCPLCQANHRHSDVTSDFRLQQFLDVLREKEDLTRLCDDKNADVE